MRNFIIVKYNDALYYTEKELSYKQLTEHFAIGKLKHFSNDHIKIIFSEKNGKPESGLLIPTSAIILDDSSSTIKKVFSDKKNMDVSIYWRDIVFFNSGIMPDDCTKMYSEGELFTETEDVIILKNPTTIMVKNKIQNHPKTRATFIVIPKVMITEIQTYDK